MNVPASRLKLVNLTTAGLVESSVYPVTGTELAGAFMLLETSDTADEEADRKHWLELVHTRILFSSFKSLIVNFILTYVSLSLLRISPSESINESPLLLLRVICVGWNVETRIGSSNDTLRTPVLKLTSNVSSIGLVESVVNPAATHCPLFIGIGSIKLLFMSCTVDEVRLR